MEKIGFEGDDGWVGGWDFFEGGTVLEFSFAWGSCSNGVVVFVFRVLR